VPESDLDRKLIGMDILAEGRTLRESTEIPCPSVHVQCFDLLHMDLPYNEFYEAMKGRVLLIR
jgi:hypothetical protein